VVPVAGGYDGANRLAGEASMDDLGAGWAWLNIGLRHWYVEGSVTVAHETAEQLRWTRPDHVVVPMASGAMALAIHRAFGDLVAVGLVPDGPPPALWVVQPAGCAPVADAFSRGDDEVRPVRPDTIAASLAMGDPPDGPDVLAAARASGGGVLAVAEGDIAGGQTFLAEHEGIAVEPAGGVVIAAVRALAADGRVARDTTVVACVTGGPHERWTAGRTDAATGMAPGRVAGTIQPTVPALAAVVREGSGPAEDPSR
jgi:threonine synthase